MTACTCTMFSTPDGEPVFLGIPIAAFREMRRRELAECPVHGERCFVAACDAPLWVTRSFRDGPTIHACRDHAGLLPRRPQEAQLLLLNPPGVQRRLL
jgi:hypothetical protein